MRTIAKFALAASLLAAPSAFAYTLPGHVVAQASSSGGFAPAEFPVQTGIRVYDNGRVENFEIYRDGHTTTKALATLAQDRVQALLNNVKAFTDVELKKEDPEAIQCTDAPGTTYLARNAQGVAVALEGSFGCIRFVRADLQQSVVPQILNGLQALNWL